MMPPGICFVKIWRVIVTLLQSKMQLPIRVCDFTDLVIVDNFLRVMGALLNEELKRIFVHSCRKTSCRSLCRRSFLVIAMDRECA